MSGQFLKKAVAITVAAALCASTGFFGYKAYAATYQLAGRLNDSEHVYVQGDDTKSIAITDNFFGSYGYNQAVADGEVFVPGDKLSEGKVDIENKTSESFNLYLYAMPTAKSKMSDWLAKNGGLTPFDADTLSAKNSDLLKEISLEVYYTPDGGESKRIYPPESKGDGALGTMDGADGMAQSSAIDIGKTGDIDKMEDLTSLLDSMKAAIDLGTFQPGDKGTLSFELVISPDAKGIIDNSSGTAKYSGFVGAVAMVDWVFVAANTEFVLPDEPPKPTPPVPRTGEETLPYTAAAVACGLGALGIYATAFRKRKKDMAE